MCGAAHYPPRRVCPDCWGAAADEMPLTNGVLETFTVVHRAPPGFRVPYAVGFARFAEGVRVFGMVEIGELDHLTVGARVRAEAGEGRPVSLRLVPSEGSTDG